MVERPIWVVTITIPKKLMSDIEQGSIELEGETLDQEDIEQAYETGADEDVYKTPDEQQNAQAQPEQVPPAPAV